MNSPPEAYVTTAQDDQPDEGAPIVGALQPSRRNIERRS